MKNRFFKMDTNGQKITKLSDEKNITRYSVPEKDVIITKRFAQTDLGETPSIRKTEREAMKPYQCKN